MTVYKAEMVGFWVQILPLTSFAIWIVMFKSLRVLHGRDGCFECIK